MTRSETNVRPNASEFTRAARHLSRLLPLPPPPGLWSLSTGQCLADTKAGKRGTAWARQWDPSWWGFWGGRLCNIQVGIIAGISIVFNDLMVYIAIVSFTFGLSALKTHLTRIFSVWGVGVEKPWEIERYNVYEYFFFFLRLFYGGVIQRGFCFSWVFFLNFHFVYANCTFMSFVYILFFIVIILIFFSLLFFACVPKFVHLSMCLLTWLLQAIGVFSPFLLPGLLRRSQTSVVKGIHGDCLRVILLVRRRTLALPHLPHIPPANDQCTVWMSPRELGLL